MSDEHGFSTRAIHAGQEADAADRCGGAPRSTRSRPTSRTASAASAAATSTAGRPTRPAPRSRSASPRSRAAAAGSPSPPAWPARTPSPRALLVPGDHVVVPDDAYGGTYRLLQQGREAAGHRALHRAHGRRRGRPRRDPSRADEDGLGRDADQPAARHRRHRGHRRRRARGRRAARRRQHLRDAPTSRARSRSAPTSSRTRRRSTPAATATSSAAPSSTATTIAVPGFEDAEERIAFHQNSIGGVAGPFDSWLTLRGLKTLAHPHGAPLRQRREGRRVPPGPRRRLAVLYPGLPGHPSHDVAARQMKRFGGMVCFQVARAARTPRSRSAARRQLWTLGESLGGVESLIEHPARMTHARVAGTELEVPARPHPPVGRHRGRRRPHRRPARGARHPRLSRPSATVA